MYTKEGFVGMLDGQMIAGERTSRGVGGEGNVAGGGLGFAKSLEGHDSWTMPGPPSTTVRRLALICH